MYFALHECGYFFMPINKYIKCISLRKDEWKLTGKYCVGTVSAEFINIVYGEFKCAVVLKDYNNYRRFETTVFSSMQMYIWV